MPALEQVVEQVKTLAPAEQQQLRRLLDNWLAPAPGDSEELREARFRQQLNAQGIVSQWPKPASERIQERTPITVNGQPISETLLEDRD